MARGRYLARPEAKYGDISRAVLSFIEKNQDCSVQDVAKSLKISVDSAKKSICRLRDQGKVKRVKFDGVKYVRFRLGLEGAVVKARAVEGMPNQKIVADWKPCTVRDPLIDLLFGRVIP